VRFTIAFYVDSVSFGLGEIDGTKSLGGSESACLGLARALSARGHGVHIFATKLDPNCVGVDDSGVQWHPAETLMDVSKVLEWDVFCSLRMPSPFYVNVRARLRILWNQDLMNADIFKQKVMGVGWALDKLVYVSEFHRQQWQDWIPELAPYGWVTKNGFDPSRVPAKAVKNPKQIIHISRPERGLEPLLEMWPQLRALVPDAELKLCRYNSMYDASGWGQVCKAFDVHAEQVNAAVGGITFLGELGKSELYQAIAESAVMWYPGVHDFAETSCIAAVEAQANGTPFVGSFKGALPETVPNGILIEGDALSPEYQKQSVAAVAQLLKGCGDSSFAYRHAQKAGREHVKGYTYDAIAGEWQAWLEATFTERYEANKAGVLAQCLYFDDHTSAKIVATELGDEDALDRCEYVMAGKSMTAEDYATLSLDTLAEMAHPLNGRLHAVKQILGGCSHVLDVACGNGAFALGLAQDCPTLKITAIDYAPNCIAAAKAAAEQLGLADRVEFICAPVWDFDSNAFSEWWHEFAAKGRRFDGLWVGEFIEHVADCTTLVDGLEAVIAKGSRVVYTCPNGPLSEYQPRQVELHRGHVHHFASDDLMAVFGAKQDSHFDRLPWPQDTPSGHPCANWLITYTSSDVKAGQRDYAHRLKTMRPRKRLSVGILAYNSEHDLLKCIDSIWPLADEILIGDTGSSDSTKAIAASVSRKVRVIDLAPIAEQPDGFAGARNALLEQATGEWFLWIDTDEVLTGGHDLACYLESEIFQGFALYQNHLQLDAPRHADTPVRIFRRRDDIRFYGCVHEQPQMGDCNGDITPAMQLRDVQLAHTGYLHEGIRRQKMTTRNFPLLIKDQQRFPDRRLGKVLILRDLVNIADYAAEMNGGRYPEHAVSYLKRAIAMFEAEFADPADKFHPIARPFYERALRVFKVGLEAEVGFAAKQGGLENAHAKPQRVWVREPAHLKRLLDWQVKKVVDEMTTAPVRVDPIVQREAVAV
jgi:glycosyltransferase involved in cell wall biosynthesis/2-polyprenyl-3-methyl-5-hydroxy-6-metoxy-1,4-benzoquinol methylase